MTTTETLTDRYIHAVLRRLPERQRPDIERELRASIADDIDGRVAAGADPAAAEREVLTQLGDPARLAAGYTEAPLHLIGPALFLDYVRLLKLILALAVPISAAVVAVTETLKTGATPASVIGATISVAITTTVHVVFWTTLVFAIIERTPALRWTPLRPWTPDHLPESQSRRQRFADLVAETVLVSLFGAFILLTPVFRFQTDANDDPINPLSPWLWDTGVVYVVVALMAAGLAADYVKYYVPWNGRLAALFGLVNLAPAGLLIWIGAQERLLNPAFAEAAGWPAPVSEWVHKGLIIGGALSVIVTAVQTVVSFVTRAWNRGDLGSLIQNAVRGLPGSPNR